MSSSTPARKTTVIHSSNHGSSKSKGSQKSSQKDLLDLMRPELGEQTWVLPTDALARALSAKHRKPNTGRMKLDSENSDRLKYYDADIDKLEPVIDMASHHFVNSNPASLLQVSSKALERDHYPGLCDFFKPMCQFLCYCLHHHEPNRTVFVKHLKFFIWDKSMKDGIDEAEPLKPDLAGLFCKEVPGELYWSPPAGGTQMKIPVEVKSSWPDLVLQAGTYARSLFSAAPLRQYALVLGYNQKDRDFRFLVFHRGGLTASNPLKLKDANDQEDFVRLFMSIFTWKDRGDAGLPGWCNENQAYLPGRGDVEHFLVNIERLLHRSTCVRGRSPRVWGFKIPDMMKKVPQVPPTMTPLIPITQTVRRSQRAQSPAGSQSQLHPNSGTRRSRGEQANSASNPPMDKAELITISPEYAAGEIVKYIPLAVDWHPSQYPLLLGPGVSAVLKSSWVSLFGAVIEPKVRGDCSGMFGLPKHVYSFWAYHTDTCITTNHLFLPSSDLDTEAMEEYRWHLYKKDTERPDYRALLVQVMQDAGSSLVSAPDLQSLITAITHAHIGYYNMIQRSYQHRDVSIWNILAPNQLSECDIAFTIDQPNAVQEEILQLCKDLSIKKQHAAILIDADMAIDWNTYFDKAHGGTKSGTEAFMSRWLLNPALTDHIHSPLDDYWSFYFVAQWACVFNPLSSYGVKDAALILYWRASLDGSRKDRDTATTDITKDPMSANKHGEFLRQAQPFLKAWANSLDSLQDEVIDIPISLSCEVFSDIADRGLLSFLKVAHKFLLPTSSTK
ncbi:hypothetical protein BDP27DRAFT_1347462 [Rhodocollybia butyracea]|uniref:Fungal-type protein kinase domain-containing protein n=1 Tax=Rhodocollybia butyracea TaxID=206335 RepID=A0A9P5TVF9_9AGAR|nr:hypothetical protein BDP27DRAFT_1347462 [Rhodocollybia butyracea]